MLFQQYYDEFKIIFVTVFPACSSLSFEDATGIHTGFHKKKKVAFQE